jgi:predicted nuclease with TOPRIM domain
MDLLKSPTMIKSLQIKQQVVQQQVQKLKETYDNPEQRNPYKFMQETIDEAKLKIEKMQQTPQILDSLTENDHRKKYLKAENKLLRESLKRMSDNVNTLIEKMNQESFKKEKLLQSPNKNQVVSPEHLLKAKVHSNVLEYEVFNSDKAI